MYFISPTVETFIDWYVRIIFTVSITLSLFTLYCLIKVRKSLHTSMRSYFIYIQIVVTLNEIHQDILFDGFPMFPQYAAFCKGVFCDMKVPMTISFAIVVLLICHVGVAVIGSLNHRHQSILVNGHKLKFQARQIWAFRIVLLISVSLPCVAMCFVPVDPIVSDCLIGESPHNLTWIRARGKMYGMIPRFYFTEMACIFMLMMLLLATMFTGALIMHITVILKTEKTKSKANSKRIIRSFANLSIQLSIPYLLIIIPASVIMLGLFSDKIVGFELSFSLYYVMHLHTIVHSLMVLGLTPAYRQFILDTFRGPCKKVHAVGYRVRTFSIVVD